MKQNKIRLTEQDLRNIVSLAVFNILNESASISSDEAKALHKYDDNFGVVDTYNFGTNKHEYKPYKPSLRRTQSDYDSKNYWDSYDEYADRMPKEKSEKDKAIDNRYSWSDYKSKSKYSGSALDDIDDYYNYNVHDNAFHSASDYLKRKHPHVRLDAFDDDHLRRFNGTIDSAR